MSSLTTDGRRRQAEQLQSRRPLKPDWIHAMLLRKDDMGLILIPQPRHSWLSGQLARTWGNEGFDLPSPFEDVCLAIEQHDIGWLDWDQRPQYDPATGLPHEFWTVPALDHTAFWSRGVQRALTYGRYPALLISLHGSAIYAMTFNPETASPANAHAVQNFLADQEQIQAELLAKLRLDPSTCHDANESVVERNRLLLLTLDTMSLHACWGVKEEVAIKNVPSRNNERTTLRLRPTNDAGTFEVHPWPFRTGHLTLVVEGKRLLGSIRDRDEFHRAYDAAPSAIVRIDVTPGTL